MAKKINVPVPKGGVMSHLILKLIKQVISNGTSTDKIHLNVYEF